MPLRGKSEGERESVELREQRSAPPSRVTAAKPRRRRHWVTEPSPSLLGLHRRQFHREESSREREVMSRERAARGRGVLSNRCCHCRELGVVPPKLRRHPWSRRCCAPSPFCHRWSRHLLGIVYRELLRRTPLSEPSFRCCPLALSRSIVTTSVVIVAARFSRTFLVCYCYGCKYRGAEVEAAVTAD
ncbi:uncharacterized protein DS421_20g691360 [Arachis hypogaea]|nr:uncharacterized protein DS421_20g691360 [Arachis hypogaea]